MNTVFGIVDLILAAAIAICIGIPLLAFLISTTANVGARIMRSTDDWFDRHWRKL